MHCAEREVFRTAAGIFIIVVQATWYITFTDTNQKQALLGEAMNLCTLKSNGRDKIILTTNNKKSA